MPGAERGRVPGAPTRGRLEWPVLILAAGACFLRWSVGAWPVDDAYITFRHSRNLVEGAGFVFNPGEMVLGTSSPFYGLLLALLGWLTKLDIVSVSMWVNGLADAAVILLLWIVARQLALPRWAAASLGVVWLFYPIGIRYSVGGMESSVAAALLLGASAAYLRGRDTATGALLAL